MNLKAQLESVMQQAVESCEVAGVNLLVEKDGEEICYCEAGMADVEKQRPMRRDTILRLYSQTKPITAAAVMILMERGVIDLCQPVSDFLPSYGKLKVWENGSLRPAQTQLRVFDLLKMTSGLLYPDMQTDAGRHSMAVFLEMDRRLFTDHAMTTREVADALVGGGLAFEPGSSWQYGTSADVLGAVVEAASGMPFAAFLKKELFDPLGMKDTAFWVPAGKQDRLASVYETVTEPDGTRSLQLYTGNHLAIRNDMKEEPAFASGGAGLASTLDDYMKFARMLINEGVVRGAGSAGASRQDSAGAAYDGKVPGKPQQDKETSGQQDSAAPARQESTVPDGAVAGARLLRPATVRYMTTGELTDVQQQGFNRWQNLEGFSYGSLMRVCKNPSRTGFFTRQGEYGWDGWLGMYFANFPEERLTILMGTQKRDAGTFALTRKLRNIVLTALA